MRCPTRRQLADHCWRFMPVPESQICSHSRCVKSAPDRRAARSQWKQAGGGKPVSGLTGHHCAPAATEAFGSLRITKRPHAISHSAAAIHPVHKARPAAGFARKPWIGR